MDQRSFDGLTRLLAGAATRRQGLRAALGALTGLAAADAVAKSGPGNDQGKAGKGRDRKKGGGNGKPGIEGPCGDGSRKDNLCTKDKQCCTGVCRKGLKNKDGKGRCRCIRNGKACSEDKNCCKGLCVSGICGGASGIPTGQACVDGDTCQDSNASCTTYFDTPDQGTFCLLPNGKSCAASTDCRSDACAGTCTAQVCTVCASGCPYTTVLEAVVIEAAGSTIRIDTGTYTEDVLVPHKVLTLTNCNGSEVTLKNATDDVRTLVLASASDTAPHPIITIRNLTITGSGTPVAGDATPVAPTAGGGGIDAYTNLILEGTTKVTGINWLLDGAGVAVWSKDEALTITLRGQAEVSNNYASGGGAGIYVDSYTAARVNMEGSAKVTGNYADSYGGGVWIGYEGELRMSGDAEVSYNHSTGEGAGCYIYSGSSDAVSVIMSDNAKVVFNSVTGDFGGGFNFYDAVENNVTMEMHNNALIADNASTDSYGGGIYSEDGGFKLLMDGNALITRNQAGATTDPGGGVYAQGGELDIRENAAIIDNTPDNCDSYATATGSKLCGVA
jgi:hypothetical protein